MISANEFKNGVVIRWNDGLYQITSHSSMKKQQREPIVRTRMTNLRTGQSLEHPFRSSDTVEDVFVEKHQIQYLYQDGDLLHFMNTATYQDVVIHKKILEEQLKYMRDNEEVTGLYCDGELLSVELPASVELKVVETQPGVRGDTAKAGTKPATLQTGAVIKVPLFINIGDMLKVDTRTGAYLERS
jgi:elongation factor P